MANTTGKKYGGRQKGTPNKITGELKELLKEFILDEFKELKPRIEELDTHQRLQILTKLLPYAIPKEIKKNDEYLNVPIEPIEFTIVDYDTVKKQQIEEG